MATHTNPVVSLYNANHMSTLKFLFYAEVLENIFYAEVLETIYCEHTLRGSFGNLVHLSYTSAQCFILLLVE